MRKVCFCMKPGVRFSVDFVGESGDGVYLSLISVRNLAEISSLALAMFARPVSEFVVGFLRQLRALRVRAVF